MCFAVPLLVFQIDELTVVRALLNQNWPRFYSTDRSLRTANKENPPALRSMIGKRVYSNFPPTFPRAANFIQRQNYPLVIHTVHI